MFVTATDADVPHIVALMNRAYRGAGAAGWHTETGYITGDRTTEPLLRADMAASPAGSLLAWRAAPAGPVIGCVWLEPLGADRWYLGSLAVDPDRQQSGLGARLLDAAEQWVAARGGQRVRMTVVNIREGLIAWYVRHGYRTTGETEPFPYGDNRFGIPQRDDLCFMVLEKRLAARTDAARSAAALSEPFL